MLVLAACAEDATRPGRAPAPEALPEPDPIEPALVTWAAEFGWDDGPVPIWTPYGTVAPRVVITLADARWQDEGFDLGRVDLWCTVEIPLADGDRAAWTDDDPRLWYALDATGAPGGTCGDADHPVAGTDDPVGAVTQGAFGVGVGEFSPAVADLLGSYYPETSAVAFGGTLRVGDLAAPDDDVYGLAWALDDDGGLQLDPTGTATPVPAAELEVGGGLARAGYWVWAVYVYPFDPAL